jgi:hypothetical protein
MATFRLNPAVRQPPEIRLPPGYRRTINHQPSALNSQPSTINPTYVYSFNSQASTLPLPLTSIAPRGSNTNSSLSFS